MKVPILAILAAGLAPAATTFTKDVAPILYARCVQCHQPNDIAPMSLLDYKSARPWAKSIREAVLTGKMPPWFADPHYGNFANDARLSARDWRLAIPRKAISGRKPSWCQAARVVSVSAASGSFEDFSSAGTAADAKASKLTTGASTPRAKI
jgi:hypothetical protein